jgi:two-component system, NtrC family, sensor histidine kinase HydH
MNTQSWVTLIACVGELAVVLLVALRASGAALATPLLLLSIDLAGWNFAQLAYHRSGLIEWHLLDMILSPLATAIAFHFMLRFLGRARQLRWALWAVYLYFGLIGATAAGGLLSESLRRMAMSRTWSWCWLAGLLPLSAITVTVLVIHLRRAASVEERNRTWLLLAAVTVISPLASSEVWADLGFDVPRLGSVGILSFNAILMLAALRFRLFDKALSPSAALSATIVASVGGIAYLSIFRAAGTNTALLVFGTLTVTLVLLAAARLIVGTVISKRVQLVRLATLGRMSAQMGHDLKNPLAALNGAAQFLREERAQGRSIDDRTEFLDLMVQQIARLTSVVDKYQRLGRVEPVRTRVEVNELVRNLVALQKFANADDIAVKAELASDIPACSMDRDLVAGALENLLQNAFEATPRATAPATAIVTVRTALARARQIRGVMLSVEDVGQGMSARTRERALDDFFTTKATGSGLGLAFVRRVAEAHGGDVSLVSKEGAGTTVRMFLPLE